jgi:hypothetical protein
MRRVETGIYLDGDIEAVEDNPFDDSMLLYYKDFAEKIFEVPELIPSYIYHREYYKGSELLIHRDREACQYSITVTVCKKGQGTSTLYFCDDEDKTNLIGLEMQEGDAIIFNGGSDYGGKHHYRDPIELDSLSMIFLHYLSPENSHRCPRSFPRPNYRTK